MYDEVLLRQRLAEFHPEPLVSIEKTVSTDEIETAVIPACEGNIDLAKANYLNVLNNEEIKKTAEDIIREYGVGTCGPRAFYGTTDVHLELEECLAKFLHMEESIIYSYGFVAISSSIAAYCKSKDLVFVDEKANFPTHQGLKAARSKVVTYAHCDADDLRRKLEAMGENRSRKFLLLEGISWATGKLCPLVDFIKVAEEYKMRIFLDETYTVGVFGKTGRGLLEHFDLETYRVDMIYGTLQGALGSIGGFCAGTNSTVEHQRLSGSGYIFSASLPTYLVKVATKSLELLVDKPGKLRQLARKVHKSLLKAGFDVLSDSEAPFQFISFKYPENIKKVYEFCKDRGVHFLCKDDGLMINLNVDLLEKPRDLEKVLQVFEEASQIISN